MTELGLGEGMGDTQMIDLEVAAAGRISQLRDAASRLRHERSANAVDGRLAWRTRLRLRVGRQLVVLGTVLLAGYPTRNASLPGSPRRART
jgi:hypothetical protein